MATGTAKVVREKGSRVKIRYTLSTATGSIVKGDPREGLAVLEFFTGYDQLMPTLEKRLIGKKEGEALRLVIPAEEAFGPYDPGLVKKKRYTEFPQGKDLEEGRWVLARDEKTRTSYGYFVKEKTDEHIVVDYNHPLAGETLVYDLEIVAVEEATPAETSLLRPCEAYGGPPTLVGDEPQEGPPGRLP